MNLNNHELECIRFYMGDPGMVKKYLGGPKAYNTINALLHDGIENELDKILEGKPIEVLNQTHLKQIVDLIQTISEAFEKKKEDSRRSPFMTYRVDRFDEIEAIMKSGKLEGFTSTCKRGFLKEYACTKQNVVLMEIERNDDVSCLDFECLFESMYAKPEEAEILLPYDSQVLSVKQLECTEEEKEQYRDMNHQPPIGKYHLLIGPASKNAGDKTALEELTSLKNSDRISLCLKELTETKALSQNNLEFYLDWKKRLRKALKNAE